jgi:hypothetical protein
MFRNMRSLVEAETRVRFSHPDLLQTGRELETGGPADGVGESIQKRRFVSLFDVVDVP